MPQRRTHQFTVTIDAPLTRADIPRLCREAALILSCTPTTTVVCDIGAVRDPDAAALDAVARLALTARRFGASVELRNACPNLVDLLELAGLSDVIRALASSGVEAGREVEDREQGVGVEEEVEPDDLTL